MRRLRVFRVLIPVLLLPFLAFLAFQLRVKERPHTPEAPGTDLAGAQAEVINWKLFDRGRRSYSALVNSARQEGEERYRLEGIQRLEVEREGAAPLVISAREAGVNGAAGARRINLVGGVEVAEGEGGVRISVPRLEIDQATGEATSKGAVALEAPTYSGEAERVVYGLEGQPTLVSGVSLRSTSGVTLVAREAQLNDGTRDFELLGDVRLERLREFLAAGMMRIWRSPESEPERVLAEGGVSGARESGSGILVQFEAARMDAGWDEAGVADRLLMSGEARLTHGSDSIAASRIEAVRVAEDANNWKVLADGGVHVRGRFGREAMDLRADNLRMELSGSGELVRGDAEGDVLLRGPDSSGEAGRAAFTAAADEIVLIEAAGRRARLARQTTRVVANQIVTDGAGTSLTATGKVEATLLPAEREVDGGSATAGLFRAEEAVHFVASELESRASGNVLTFTGTVRGWQGERTLSGKRVTVDQIRKLVSATGNVNTRVPRDESIAAVSQQHYVQISAENMEYTEKRGVAVYSGKARIRQAEGWMEADRIEIDLGAGRGDGIKEVRAFDQVRFEFRTAESEGMPRPVSGEGDRAVYTPGDQTVRLYGDARPASVRRAAERTATGRVLRYRLDLGKLEVESGDQDRVRVRTSGSRP